MQAVVTTTSRLLGFGLAAAFVPQAYADVNVGRSAVAWLCVALLVWLIPSVRWSLSGGLLLGLALVSFAWAPEPLNALNGILQLGLLAGAFVVGRAGCAENIFQGAAWGMIVNSALAIAQSLGWHPVMEVSTASPAGLFGNRDFMAEAALIVVIPLVWNRRWLMTAALMPALMLPLDRTVILAGGLVTALVVWKLSRTVTIIAVSMACIGAAVVSLSPAKFHSAQDRIELWKDTFNGLTVMGRGVGQFYNTFPESAIHQPIERIRSDHAHNDWLELAYELGIVGIVLGGIFAAGVLSGPTSWEKLAFLALCVMSCFAFPLHNPTTGILGLVAAGGVYRRRDMECGGLADGTAYRLFGPIFRYANAWNRKRHQTLSDQPILSCGTGRMADAQSNPSGGRNRGNQFLPAARSVFTGRYPTSDELRIAIRGHSRSTVGRARAFILSQRSDSLAV